MNQNPNPPQSKTDQLKEIVKAAIPATNTGTNTPPKTVTSDKPFAPDAETINTLAHIKRLALDNQQGLKEKPDRAEVAAIVAREVEAAKREIVAAIPPQAPPPPAGVEAVPAGLPPGTWFGLILALLVIVGGAAAWQTWQLHKLDMTLYGELDQIYKEIQRYERH